MSNQNAKDKTYYSISKWFTWASFIIICIPIVILVLHAIATYWRPELADSFKPAVQWLLIISAAVSAIWIILNIIMFIAAGNLRGIKSPLAVRLFLLIALALVLFSVIINILSQTGVLVEGQLLDTLILVSPIATMVGYLVGGILGSRIKHALA